MSFINRDALTPEMAITSMAYSNYRKFQKAWGTTYLPGPLPGDPDVHVYSPKLYIWNGGFNTNIHFKRFVLSLGMSYEELISMDIDSEIDSVWFYFKPGFVWDGTTVPDLSALEPIPEYDATLGLEPPAAQDIIDIYDETFVEGDIIEVTVSYGGDLQRYIYEHELGWEATDIGIITTGLNKDIIRGILHAKPWFYFGNLRHLDYDAEIDGTIPFQIYDGNLALDTAESGELYSDSLTPVTKVAVTVEGYEYDILAEEPRYDMGAFALMDNGSVFEPILNAEGEQLIYDEKITTASTSRYDGEALEYSYKVKFRYTDINNSTSLINEMMTYYDNWIDISDNTSYTDDVLSAGTTDTIFKSTLTSLMTPLLETDSLYYEGHLRVDAIKYMKKRDFLRLEAKLDTDYKVKEASWWEKVFAIVIIIIAIVVAVITQQYYAAQGIAVSVAAGAGAASLTLTIGMIALSQFGGASAAGLVKKIGAFAQIVGIVAMIAGLTAIIQNAMSRAAQEAGRQAAQASLAAGGTGVEAGAAAKVAIDQFTQQTLLSQVGSALKMMATDALASVSQLFSAVGEGSLTSTQSLSIANKAMDVLNYVTEHERKEDYQEYEDAKSAHDAEMKEYEEERFDNVLKDMAKVLMIETERVGSYDAITLLDNKIRKESPDGWFDKLEAHHGTV